MGGKKRKTNVQCNVFIIIERNIFWTQKVYSDPFHWQEGRNLRQLSEQQGKENLYWSLLHGQIEAKHVQKHQLTFIWHQRLSLKKSERKTKGNQTTQPRFIILHIHLKLVLIWQYTLESICVILAGQCGSTGSDGGRVCCEQTLEMVRVRRERSEH